MLGYNAKLVPQPQDALAFGLLMPECGADQVIDEVDLGTGEISQSVGRPAIVTTPFIFLLIRHRNRKALLSTLGRRISAERGRPLHRAIREVPPRRFACTVVDRRQNQPLGLKPASTRWRSGQV